MNNINKIAIFFIFVFRKQFLAFSSQHQRTQAEQQERGWFRYKREISKSALKNQAFLLHFDI